MNKLLRELEKYTIYITVFSVPVVFLELFFNTFLTPKIALLVFGAALALIFRLLRIASSGTFEFNLATFDLPVFLIIFVYTVSGIFASPNRTEAFFLPGTAAIVTASGVLYFLANQLESAEKDRLMYILIGSAFVISLFYLLTLAGLFEKFSALPDFLKNKTFTPQGALLPTAMYLAVAIPYGLGLVIKTKDYLYKALLGSATFIIAIALAIISFNIVLDRANFRVATFDSSMSVVFDSLKTSAVLGAGPSNYLTAYTRYRPITANLADDWQVRYAHARNFVLTSITETGFAGAFALILLIIALISKVRAEIKAIEHKKIPTIDFKTAAVVLLFILLAMFPALAPEILMVLFVGLAIASTTKTSTIHIGNSKTSKVPAIIAATPLLLGIGYLLFTGGRTLAAEATYKTAVNHLAKNEGTQSYEALRRAITLNSTVDRYHATYSQINFLLAEAVSRKGNDLDDSERQIIGQLIQQAIREAKTTVSLNPTRAGNWEVLAALYRKIIPLSQGASDFAIKSYGQAIAFDPINPDLRIALGGIWYSAKDYKNAIDSFKLAVVAKPNHANARYNLAAAYREDGQTDRAIAELKVVLTLVDADSKDYETAKSELDALEQKKATSSSAEGETLTPPITNKPALEPQINLPEGSGPEVSPSANPSPSTTSQP